MPREFLVRVGAAWVTTRAVILLFAFDLLPYPWRLAIVSDAELYAGWSQMLRSGQFPVDDVAWQYPPGAAAVLVLPDLLPGGYLGGFLAVTAVADAIVLLMLLRLVRQAGESAGSRAGVWAWVAGIPLLGPFCYGRYDVMVTALMVGALAFLARRPAVFGVLTGLGAAVKVIPIVLLFGAPRGRRGWPAFAAAGACGAAVMLTAGLPAVSAFLDHQRERGVQMESVPATFFLIARHLGWGGELRFQYGALEFVGPGVEAAATAALVLSVLALAWLAYWRWRSDWSAATPYDVALTATLLAVVTSRVLSPQYFTWLVGLAAVCLVRKDSTQRAVAWAVLGCAALTQVVFPTVIVDVIHERPEGDYIVAARNLMITVIAIVSVLTLWRSTRPDRSAASEHVESARPAREPAELRAHGSTIADSGSP